jgi:formylglycine-generating enzyme required for sulfatase activity
VHDWATNHGYRFANPGLRGDDDNGTDDHPVTTINWYDALAWCNALSEYCGFSPVYFDGNTVYTDSHTPPLWLTQVTDAAAPGYRLPDVYEWEYASRRKPNGSLTGGDRPAGYEGPHLDPENAGSTLAAWGPFAWYDGNASGTAVRGTRSPTGSGLYDLSGNVQEWCHGDEAPLLRGGAWSAAAAWLCTAARMTNALPGLAHEGFGFRVVRRTP